MAKSRKKYANVSGEYTGEDACVTDAAQQLSSEEEDLLARVKADFLADFRANQDWLKESKESSEFYDGKQWKDEELQVLRERGQPDVTINRVKPRIDSIVGLQQQIRVDTKAFARGDRENEVAELSEKLRDIERNSDFDEDESTVFKDQIIDGRGWYECGKRWESLQAHRFVRRRENVDIIPDRNGRKADMSDWKRVHDSVMVELEDAQATFPKRAGNLESAMNAPMTGIAGVTPRVRPDQYANAEATGATPNDGGYGEFVDKKRRQIRITKTFYRRLEVRKYLYSKASPDPIDVTSSTEAELEKQKEALEGSEVITQSRKTLNCITFAWNCVLEHLKDIREFDETGTFPLIMVPGYVERRSALTYGLTRQMKDPQREVNKRRSKLLFRLSVNQVRYEKGAFDDPESMRKEFAKPDGFVEQNPQFQVIVDKGLDIAQSEFALLQLATTEVDNAAGGRELEGRSSANSGREFQLRQQQAANPLRELFGNLRQARRAVARYHGEDILEEIKLSTPAGQEPAIPLTKYDYLVEEAPESLNLNGETFEQLVNLAQSVPTLGQQMPLDMILKVAPLNPKVKEEFLARVKQMQEQQAQAQMQQMLMLQSGGGGNPQQPQMARG